MISVLMPVYQQAHFIRRAVYSLLCQSFNDWELIVVDDGSFDGPRQALGEYLDDPRLRFLRLERNRGLGAALNVALDVASGERIAYLPADDLYYAGHLAALNATLDQHPAAAAAFSGVRHHYNRSALETVAGHSLQPVQVLHRRTDRRWIERHELVSDDLERLFWGRLRARGEFIPTHQVTCEWVDHPDQGHKRLREPLGGINPYRQYYRVDHPLRFHTTVGSLIDEPALYRGYRRRPPALPSAGGLKILLVGELAYNADRVLAFEERGHQLFGLWMPNPYWYNTVGPLPFGSVQDIPFNGWREAVRRIQPDLIYALLNWQAVPFAHQVLCDNPGIPFVWHFKEGPFISLEQGHWAQLADLHRLSDGQIYSSPEMRDWFETALPGSVSQGHPYVLDGDLPKADWFTGRRAALLSEQDGELHTVVPGRPIGLHPPDVAELAGQRIHLHFYGDFTHGQWRAWIEKTLSLAPHHIHLHSQVDQDRWVSEFSQYDAGWLHYFKSDNAGEIHRASWDDLNYPARMATLAAAGLPMLQRHNPGAVVAVQNLARALDIGLFFTGMGELREQLRDLPRMQQLRANIWDQRARFTFDAHVDGLVEYFRQVIRQRALRQTRKVV
ncbi:MAG: glycosyltransferase family 2 protein [Chloroflexota bacterium]